MASISIRTPRQPLIAVVGATGTGKSQLAVELAERFNGEVVNGDAMQLYAGMSIITNKITEVERRGIPHHLIGTINLDEPTWVVSTFVEKALAVIKEIRARGKLPILVGGTHYYTQSLLFHDALASEKPEGGSAIGLVEAPEEDFPILAESTEKLYEELMRVDPIMAKRWHPQDRRKIQRSLMIWLQTGRRASEIYGEQQAVKHASLEQSSLRFPDLLVFWVHAEQDALRKRLEARVDKMLEKGLLAEVQQLHDYLSTEHDLGHTIDQTRGIWVSIGFKEFKSYYEQLLSGDAELIEKARLGAIELTKIATRQYAKSQTRWIRLKLLRALRGADAAKSLYLLDSSDLARYEQDVVETAASLTKQFLEGATLPPPEALSELAATVLAPEVEGAASDGHVVRHCDVCGVHCATDKQWEDHKRSKAHRKLSRKAVLPSNGLSPR